MCTLLRASWALRTNRGEIAQVPDAFSRAQDKLDAKRHKYNKKHASKTHEVPYEEEEAAERRAHEAAKLAGKMNAHPDSALKKLDEDAVRMIAKETPAATKAADVVKKSDTKKADAVEPKEEPKAESKAAKKHKGAIKMEEIPVMPDDTDGATRAQLAKMKELKKYEKSHKGFSKKIQQVHLEWAKKHHGPPHTAAEQKEYSKLLTKIVGDDSPLAQAKHPKLNPFHAPDLNDQFKVAGGKGVSSLAAEEEHSEAEIKMAKVKALQDLEAHDPKVKTKIAQVHHQWMKAGHKAPPSTPAEEKEYHALMEKIVGHPDISFQTN